MPAGMVLEHPETTPTHTSITTHPRVKITTFPPPPVHFDPLKADQLTLWRYGYPRRPESPALLKRWQELVGKPRQYVAPTIKRNEHRRHGPRILAEGTDKSGNWSGAVVYAPSQAAFLSVAGSWTLPTPDSPSANGTEYDSSIWVGIDGDDGGSGSNDVFQAGVECDVVTSVEKVTSRTVYAWIEWFPDFELDVTSFPVASGDTVTFMLNLDQDCLPGLVAEGQWQSIRIGQTLVSMHDGRVLDWVPFDGSWRLWNYDPTSTRDCLPGDPVAQGQWQTIRTGHTLVPMHDGLVLDWVPFDGSWRLWNYDPTSTRDCLPGDPVAQGQWQTIRTGHTLVPMHDGLVLDWVPFDGSWRLWNYDPTSPKDCLPGDAVAQGQWESIRIDHTLVPMQDGLVLDWVPFDGSWRLWNYDPTSTKDCLPGDPVAQGQWESIRIDHTLVPMRDGLVLDWVLGDGSWRLWNYDPNNFSRASGSVMLINESRNKFTSIRMTAPNGITLTGNCAEWIVERPSLNNVLTNLADDGSVTISGADAVLTGGVIVKADAGDNIDMYDDSGNEISKATVNGDTVTVTYV